MSFFEFLKNRQSLGRCALGVKNAAEKGACDRFRAMLVAVKNVRRFGLS